MTFLAKIAEKNNYKSLFEDPATLSSICEKVVIPNMEFRGEWSNNVSVLTRII